MEQRLSEDRNWIASTGLSRRHLVGATIATAGFAAACRPVASTAQHVDSEGLEEGNISISSGDSALPAYRARPKGKDDAPVLVVVHEIFGVHEWIKGICRRFAKAGYYAIAPDLFARQGDATREPDIQTLIANIVSKTPDDQVMTDIDATVAFAGKNGGNANRLGITGFCWGGRIVWLYAAHNVRLDAGVAFYGRLIGNSDPLHPRNPIDVVNGIQAPVLGLYGGKDKGIPVSDVDAMRAALKQAGKPGDLIVYPEAEHGFMADYRPSYNEKAASEAFASTLDWFKTYLAGDGTTG